MASPETSISLRPEKESTPPPNHLAIVIAPHAPWSTEEIENAAQITSTLRDVSSLLNIKHFTVYMEAMHEADQILNAMTHPPENLPDITVSFHSLNERERILAAVKKMKNKNTDPEKVDEAHFATYLPRDPDLVIITGETSDSMVAQHGTFQMPGLTWNTAYSEFATIESDLLDMTPDDLLNKISEYQSRKRKFGALPEQDKEF